METLPVAVQILIGALAVSSLIVAGVAIAIGLIVRRILLRMHRMLMDIENTESYVLEQAEQLMAKMKSEGSVIMRIALAIAGAFLLKQTHYTAKRKRNVTRANRM